MRTLLVATALLAATLPVGTIVVAQQTATQQLAFCDGGPNEPIPQPFPRRA